MVGEFYVVDAEVVQVTFQSANEVWISENSFTVTNNDMRQIPERHLNWL